MFTKFNFAVRSEHKLKYSKNNPLTFVKQNNYSDKHNKLKLFSL